jgi:hypothetical protein
MLEDPSQFADIDEDLTALGRWNYLPRDVAAIANDPRSLLLLTIPKSGTTWLRFLLVNYAVQQRKPGAARIDYAGLKRFSAERELIRAGKNPVRRDLKPLLPEFGMNHLLYQPPRRGVVHRDIEEHGGPKLMAYRNVLDYLVSNYFYFYEYRDGARHLASQPRDLIPGYVRYWALCWRLFTERIMPEGAAALVSYDRLQADTASELTRALTELGVDVDGAAIQRALPLASATAASDDEVRLGTSLVGRLDRGSFVRDGSVGQWRDHFDEADIASVRQLLQDLGVDPAAALPPELA